MSTLNKAISIAVEAHGTDVDKGGNLYILHPLRMMLTLTEPEEMMAAVLHDVVEDVPGWTLERIRSLGFSEAVIAGIEAVTKRPGEDYFDFVRRGGADPIGRRVKKADIIDNMDISRIQNPTAKDYKRLDKYKKALAMLEEMRGEV